jgi:hypothetical protein
MQGSDNQSVAAPVAAVGEASTAVAPSLQQASPEHTRRQFVGKLRLVAAAAPVVVGLSLSWTANASPLY